MCDTCGSERILKVFGKCSDLCVLQFNESEKEGYVASDCGIGGGDDIDFDLCLECGKVQGEFPLPDPEFSQEDEDDFLFDEDLTGEKFDILDNEGTGC